MGNPPLRYCILQIKNINAIIITIYKNASNYSASTSFPPQKPNGN